MDNKKIILASKSPRRQELVKELNFEFEIRSNKDVEEIYPDLLDPYKVPEYLAALKSSPIISSLSENEILLTSDTIVLFQNQILGKPKSKEEGIKMLKTLSGKTHEVITGVQLKDINKTISFSSITKVFFKHLTDEEISFYIEKHNPLDKAGSYAIQEWIGYIGVSKIEGCYYNVMGLPLHDIYKKLKKHFYKD
ncbi:MAG: septum formation protein Maf [Crocinitomicaceae bacterium]|nr:septum formation protein Maf [Crocinitomicaceae bacterium]|tara:strand:- start:68538 stop:69119 length:582 start_codon:yes stop_codon:yes gene_type:complete